MAAGAQPTRDLCGWILREVATTRIYDFLRETPLVAAPGLSRLARAPTLLKREDLQPIFSFKIRGAYHKLAALSEKSARAESSPPRPATTRKESRWRRGGWVAKQSSRCRATRSESKSTRCARWARK